MQTVLILLLLAGIIAIPAGLFISFAGSMSDAPALGDEYGRNGCIIAGVGLVALVSAIVALVLS